VKKVGSTIIERYLFPPRVTHVSKDGVANDTYIAHHF